nr:hypothetical protein [Tanacetum cinerariifolium]
DTITVDTIRRAAAKRRTSPTIDEVFYNKTSMRWSKLKTE